MWVVLVASSVVAGLSMQAQQGPVVKAQSAMVRPNGSH